MLSQEELDQLLEQEGQQQDASGDEGDTEKEAASSDSQEVQEDGQPQETSEESSAENDNASDDDLSWEDAFKEAASGGDAAAAKAMQENQGDLGKKPEDQKSEPADFQNFQKDASSEPCKEGPDNLEFILDLPLEISVELGRSKMQIRDLLQLGQGSIVELNKMAGEPAEIYVNNKLLAKGEVVVVNEKFGIRLSEIISPADRVKTLG